MYADLAAICERVHICIRVKEITISHKLKQMCHLRLLEKSAAWKRDDRFDRREVTAERQHRPLGHLCSVDDPKHPNIKIYFEPRRLPTPQTITESMWAEVNWRRQELLWAK